MSVLPALCAWTRRDRPQWRVRVVLGFRQLVDGTWANCTLMWRRVNGVEEWRLPTDDEAREALDLRHW